MGPATNLSKDVMTTESLQDYVFTSKYGRYNPELQRRETFDEAVARVKQMHLEHFALAVPPGEFATKVVPLIDEAFDAVFDRLVLGSQRALQFGGVPIHRNNGRMYNCFGKETSLVTDRGVKSFEELSDGQAVGVMMDNGEFSPGVVRNFGRQKLTKITIGRGGARYTVRATSGHRWLLRDGTDTTGLKVGDRLQATPQVFGDFVYEDAPPDERLWWAYGYVYGDGTCVQNKDGEKTHSMVRLCKKDQGLLPRFTELGFNHSFPPSSNGDPTVYTGQYLKTPPAATDDPRLLRAFVAGYLTADGERNTNPGSPSPYRTIQVTGPEKIEWVRKNFPKAGVFLVSETPQPMETNFGPRSAETVRFRLTCGQGHTAAAWCVVNIEDDAEEDVWCVEVANQRHSLMLPFGLPTGNCTTSYCDRPRFFQESLWLLLCGCGVGFSVQDHHISKLPPVSTPTGEEVIYQIPDSIEGWADALGVLLSSYFAGGPQPFPEFYNKRVKFDYSLIRPKGSVISTSVGKAPGPEPLKRSLEKIRELLAAHAPEHGYRPLRSIDAYDILMHASDAVLSGGVRRSATICLFSPSDELMAKAKTGNWYTDNPQRARSNNSAVLVRGETTREEFDTLMSSVREFGEPGFVWTDHRDITYNPCVEIGLYPQLDGESGWAFCNLCEINIGAITDETAFRRAARAAAILGTLQADYTKFDYLPPVSEAIAKREALLGVSMTGMMEHPLLAFNPRLQKEMAEYILEVNAEVAEVIGINPTARATCVKPAGTTSCILGTSSGIHPHHARRYFRRAQANETEAVAQYFSAHNPQAVEKSVWNPNGTDVVLTFCIEANEEATVKREVTALDLLEYVKLTQQHWVSFGRRPERCAQPWLSHNVSNTITVKDSEWDEVADYIYENRQWFAGISLLPEGGDLDYPQAPFVEVLTPEDILETYGTGALFASGLIVDGLHAFDNNLWAACDCVLGRGTDPESLLDGHHPSRVRSALLEVVDERFEWIRRATQFADRYFGGNVLKMTRCLKRVHTAKQWEDLVREYQPVDYTLLIETEDNTTRNETIACSGGKCDIL